MDLLYGTYRSNGLSCEGVPENVKSRHIEELCKDDLCGEIWTIDLQNGKHR